VTGVADGPGVVVRISGLGQGGGGAFPVRVSFGDYGEYDVTVTDPAEDGSEALLAWYFEEHLEYPFLDKDKEQQAVSLIAEYGEKLFAQVMGGKAYVDYRKLRDRGLDRCRIEVSGPAGLHRLHWEALRDPDLPAPLAVRLPVTRRVTGQESKFDLPDGCPALNVLVVTARPFGRGDVGYRTVSRPLLDAVRTAALPVTVDLVRPGTWAALTEHLRAATERHDSGWYQVVHFDVHGAFEDYAALERGRKAERLLLGPGGLAPFEGRQGFVFFETAEAGKAEPVPAQDVADLLAEHRVPVAVLNACQSAMQNDSEAGLAQQLAEAGVPVAVGMAYSVTVTAAERAMPVLYRKIAEGAELTAAVQAARRDLLDHPARHAYFDQDVDLADWMLPVMFAQQPLHIRLRPMNDAEQTAFYERSATVGDEPATEYGFVGRDLDIQAVERQILSASNILLVQGMAGAGKSTLLTHLAWWWQRTGLVDQAFRFSYEDRAWTASQIVREIRAKLLSPAEHARADAMSEAAQAEQVAGLLRATRHLLILDNTESITATPAAIPHALDPAEQQKLKALLSRLRSGKTLVLLGSREAETWLSGGSTAIGTYPLPGLDRQAASVLVDRILRRHGATRWVADPAERRALDDLVTLLGGYPLPLTVVLPVLASAPPSAVLADLRAGGEAADPAGLIRKAVEYSHGKLDPALQASLQLLAPFTAVIPTGPILQNYQDLLLQHEAVQSLGPVDLAAALDQAIAVGLAAPHDEMSYLAQVQPILPWFLRSRLAGQSALQAAAAQTHYQHYYQLAPMLLDMLRSTDAPQQRATGQAAARAEYANLTTAVAFGLRTSRPVTDLSLVLDDYLTQTQAHDTRRHLLDATITAYPAPAGKDQQLELALLRGRAGATALAQHRLDDARAHYQAALGLQQAAGERQQQGGTYHQLGRVAHEQRRYAEAEASYRPALDIFLAFGDRYNVAIAYHNLGRVAQEQRRFAEAEASYQNALDIKLELGNQPSAALTYGQLGAVAHEQRRYAEAEASYRQALDIFLEFGDQHRAATTYYQLGVVAQSQGRYAEAEASYRQALDIYLQFNDRYETADIYQQLGNVAEEQGRYAEAEASYRQALDIYLEFGDRHGAAGTYHNLGRAAQQQRQYAEAEASYRQALDIYLEFGDRHRAAAAYHGIGTTALEQGRYAEAEASYRQALDIRTESDPRSASSTATRLGIVLDKLGRHHEALRALLDAAVMWRQQTGGWDSNDLAWLHRESALAGDDELAAMIEAHVPAELAADLRAAIQNATDPADVSDNPVDGPGT
jgi:tetratricopeptide (TPR) repeat protein